MWIRVRLWESCRSPNLVVNWRSELSGIVQSRPKACLLDTHPTPRRREARSRESGGGQNCPSSSCGPRVESGLAASTESAGSAPFGELSVGWCPRALRMSRDSPSTWWVLRDTGTQDQTIRAKLCTFLRYSQWSSTLAPQYTVASFVHWSDPQIQPWKLERMAPLTLAVTFYSY